MNEYRSHGRMYRSTIGGVIAGIFIICLAVAIYFWGLSANWLLPILFLGLGLASLVGCITAPNHKAAYGSLFGVVWFLGLSLCFVIGFWPWILLPVGFSIILGALAAPILSAMRDESYRSANQHYTPKFHPKQSYQPGESLPLQRPYWSPKKPQQRNQELQQEESTQQEIEQQHQHV